MMTTCESICLQKTAPVVGSYDVVVCGGGVAGVAAAVSAARAGMKTALIERQGCFGGTATLGYVTPISGFYHKEKRVVGGIAWEIVERLEKRGAAQVELPKGHVSVHPEDFKLVMQQMLTGCGVTLYTNAYLSDCVQADGRITHLVIESKSGTEAIAARCVIDATGEADVCRRAGVPMMPVEKSLQPISLCFVLEGVDATTPLLRDYVHHDGKNGHGSCQQEIHAYLDECIAAGKLRQFGGPWFNTMVKGNALTVNITRIGANAADRADYTRAELMLREDMFTIVGLLKEKYPEFRNCSIVSSGVNAGVRETRRIEGMGMASGETFTVRPECPVARCAHPMDMHKAGSAAQTLIRLDEPGYVPHTALIPKKIGNLLAAGRCICADAAAFASLRVQATLMAIGEAAGLMAAMHCESGVPVQQTNATVLKNQLERRGSVL